MADLIALFPLGTVLLPGAPLPLHIFEERYRRLVDDLLSLPEAERGFGVVAIKAGREVGADGVTALHEVGCLAQVVAVQANPDGTFQIEAVGTRRFRLLDVDHEAAYLRGTVEWLPEPPGEADALVPLVTERYMAYRAELARLRDTAVVAADLPTDPRLLSYVVAATVLADVGDRQAFLEQYDAASRLAVESHWLHRETALLRQLHAVPADRMLDIRFSTS